MHKELWELFFDVKGIVGAVCWWARNCGSWPGSQTSVPGTPSTSPVPRLLGTQQSPGAAPDSRPSWKPLGTGPGIQSLAAGQTDYNQSIINAVWYTFMNTPISNISYQQKLNKYCGKINENKLILYYIIKGICAILYCQNSKSKVMIKNGLIYIS